MPHIPRRIPNSAGDSRWYRPVEWMLLGIREEPTIVFPATPAGAASDIGTMVILILWINSSVKIHIFHFITGMAIKIDMLCNRNNNLKLKYPYITFEAAISCENTL